MRNVLRPIPLLLRRAFRRGLLVALCICLVGSIYFLFTDNPTYWPIRNTLEYHLLQQWWRFFPAAPTRPAGALAGEVRDPAGRPIGRARVLIAAADGRSWSAESDASGRYRITDVPPAGYVPVAGATGYANYSARRGSLGRTIVRPGLTTILDIELRPTLEEQPTPAEQWRLGPPGTLRIEAPLPATAEERRVSFTVGGRANQPTFFYTRVGGDSKLPTLLTVYPGPADTWTTVSLPLAQAGYAVIAVGPAYALDLEPDVDDLLRVLEMLRAGEFPRADPERIGVLGGSYSSLHVFRLAQRYPKLADAILLLGPPTDLFELRRQFVAGDFFPPFGLDQALVALGFPDRDPERYWRYSAVWHVRGLEVPTMLIHSKADEVVPFTQSQRMADELSRLGKRHELHILEGMGHYLLEPERTPAIDDLFSTTVGFFDRELGESR